MKGAARLVIMRALRALPNGGSLPEEIWQRRHRAISILLWLHFGAIFVFAMALGRGVFHSLSEASIVALAALIAGLARTSRAVRSGAAVLGLLSSSAILVHLSDGLIEMHFHFFVMVAVVTLYQDWFPFLLAIGYVVVHHGLLGAIAPTDVYNHPAAQQNPWGWAAIHGLFIFGESVALVVAWRLTEQGFQDSLTKLPNRTLFMDRINHALERAQRDQAPVALLFLDLDGFKTVNDALGHAAGDDLLIAVADRLRTTLRSGDTAARLGGDEFGVLLEGTEEGGGDIAAERILDSLQAPFRVQGREIFISASIGVATIAGVVDGLELLRNADAAMYAAKANGKGRFEPFAPSMHVAVVEQLALQNELQRAAESSEFVLQYQPVVELSTNHIAGVEALIRWQHPRRGLVAPLEFIPLAEESGLIVDIGRWVLDRACRQAREWQLSYRRPASLSLAVNVSARQLRNRSFVDDVAHALESSGLSPETLILEITEHALAHNVDEMVERLGQLKALGVRLAVDDFGTGYSSLSYLQRFPVDILKLDRSFVVAGGNRRGDTSLARTIVKLGKSLNLRTVAEGIETSRQLRALRAMGCTFGQGFHFARPLWPGQLEELLDRRGAIPRPFAERLASQRVS